MDYSSIDTLYAFDDGDVITPGMGVSIASGHALAQFYDPGTKLVSEDSDFTVAANRPTIYPLCYSSKRGEYVIPTTVGQQWYYNNLQVDNAGILDASGKVKDAYKNLFAVVEYELNGKKYPALKIIGNLVTEDDQTNKTIYYVSTVDGKQVVCKIDIPINVSTGTLYQVVISCVNSEGQDDTVINTVDETLTLTCFLNSGNTEVEASEYYWEKLVCGAWTRIADKTGFFKLKNNGKQLVVYSDGIGGLETFRACCKLDGKLFSNTIPLSDVRDPFIVNIGRSTESNIIKVADNVTYTPMVYERHSQVLQTGWNFTFTFTDGKEWTDTKTGNSASISGRTIKDHKVVYVQIVASKADK